MVEEEVGAPVVRGPAGEAERRARRLELGGALGLVSVVGVGLPRGLAGWVGSGSVGEVELRTRRGLLVEWGVRALQQRDGELRERRVRVRLALGYGARRGRFELRALAGVTAEPWCVTRRVDGGRAEFGPPLLGGLVALIPGVTAGLGPGLGLRVGLRLEAAGSVAAGTRAAVQVDDAGGRPRFRVGGVELAMAVEVGLRWDVGRAR